MLPLKNYLYPKISNSRIIGPQKYFYDALASKCKLKRCSINQWRTCGISFSSVWNYFSIHFMSVLTFSSYQFEDSTFKKKKIQFVTILHIFDIQSATRSWKTDFPRKLAVKICWFQIIDNSCLNQNGIFFLFQSSYKALNWSKSIWKIFPTNKLFQAKNIEILSRLHEMIQNGKNLS